MKQSRVQQPRQWRPVSAPPTTSTRPSPGRAFAAVIAGGLAGLISGACVSGSMILIIGIEAMHRFTTPLEVVGSLMLASIAFAIFGGACYGSWVIRRFFAPRSGASDRPSGAAGLPLRGRWLACFVFAMTAFLIAPAMITGLGLWLVAR